MTACQRVFPPIMAKRFRGSATLPADWTDEPPPPSTKHIGDLLATEARSAVRELPSVIIPGEPNCLLNPSHPGFRKIVIGKPEPFSFDPRLIT